MLISQQRLTPKISDLFGLAGNCDPLKKYISKPYLYWMGSGREGLRQILLCLGTRQVGVPAYTCQVVKEAIKRANCKTIYYDSGVIADIKRIEKVINQIDVLIVSYNFGFLPEIDKIVELCKKNKVILIEDCAQALGATYNNKLAGSFGDYAFYSFGISKNIGFCGGLIASKNEIKLPKLKKFPRTKLLNLIFEVIISNLFFNKHFYPLTSKLLSSELNKKQESLSYSCPSLAKKVVLTQVRRYDQILQWRRKNADYCMKELERVVNFIKPIKDSNPAWLYFTILADNKTKLVNKLLKEGVELGEMKTFRCLDEESKLALDVENKVLTFALYRPFNEIKFIVKKIKRTCK